MHFLTTVQSKYAVALNTFVIGMGTFQVSLLSLLESRPEEMSRMNQCCRVCFKLKFIAFFFFTSSTKGRYDLQFWLWSFQWNWFVPTLQSHQYQRSGFQVWWSECLLLGEEGLEKKTLHILCHYMKPFKLYHDMNFWQLQTFLNWNKLIFCTK